MLRDLTSASRPMVRTASAIVLRRDCPLARFSWLRSVSTFCCRDPCAVEVGTTPPEKPAVPAVLAGAVCCCWGAYGTPPRSCMTGGATRIAAHGRKRVMSMVMKDSRF